MKNNNKGEIASILTIAGFVVITVSALATSFITNTNRNTQSSRAEDPGICRDNPVAASEGYIWLANCGESGRCTNNSQCPTGAANQSGWCYGFSSGPRCLRHELVGSSNPQPTQPSQSNPTPTTSAIPNACNSDILSVNYNLTTKICTVKSKNTQDIGCYMKNANDSTPVGCGFIANSSRPSGDGNYLIDFDCNNKEKAQVGGLKYSTCRVDNQIVWNAVTWQNVNSTISPSPSPASTRDTSSCNNDVQDIWYDQGDNTCYVQVATNSTEVGHIGCYTAINPFDPTINCSFNQAKSRTVGDKKYQAFSCPGSTPSMYVAGMNWHLCSLGNNQFDWQKARYWNRISNTQLPPFLESNPIVSPSNPTIPATSTTAPTTIPPSSSVITSHRSEICGTNKKKFVEVKCKSSNPSDCEYKCKTNTNLLHDTSTIYSSQCDKDSACILSEDSKEQSFKTIEISLSLKNLDRVGSKSRIGEIGIEIQDSLRSGKLVKQRTLTIPYTPNIQDTIPAKFIRTTNRKVTIHPVVKYICNSGEVVTKVDTDHEHTMYTFPKANTSETQLSNKTITVFITNPSECN